MSKSKDAVKPTKARPIVLRFSEEEFNTVLAALRCLQQGGQEALDGWEDQDFGPLVDDVKDIDRLCERINTGG